MLEYKGLMLKTSDDVYEPAEDSFLAAELIEKYLSEIKEGHLSVLDMGTGTGILGLIAARSGKVDRITFADINDDALNLSRENYKSNSKLLDPRADFVKSDLFNDVKGSYDLMIFNAPYLPHEEIKAHANEWDGGSEGVGLSIEFLKQALPHMKRGAHIILTASSLSSLDSLKEHLKSEGLRIIDSSRIHVFFEDMLVLLIGS